MNCFEVQVLKGKLDSSELSSDIRQVVRPFYVDPAALVERELSHCNVLYSIRSRNGEYLAFAMLCYEQIVVMDKVIMGIYVGLSATSERFQNKGLGVRLWARAHADAIAVQNSSGERLIIFGTCATPEAYFGLAAFNDIDPAIDGTYRQNNLSIAEAIRYKYGWQCNGHPFALKGIAKNTLYSTREALRIQKIVNAKAFHLLPSLGINERDGDRLLMVGCLRAERRKRDRRERSKCFDIEKDMQKDNIQLGEPALRNI